jgi:ketosteroid isomerase-like protein
VNTGNRSTASGKLVPEERLAMKSVRTWFTAGILLSAVAWAGVAAQSAADRKAAEAAIIKADEAFCQATIDHDVDRFRSLVADEATFGGGTPGQTRGLAAIVNAWTPFLRAGGPTLTWKPTHAEVLVAADVGYTVGTWERRAKAADGTTSIAHGQYMTVWQKQADGSWKAVFDTGSEEATKQ